VAIRNLIFDWSGTLVDDFPPVFAATNAVFEAFGEEPWTEGQFRERFYLPFTDFYRQWLPLATMEELDRHYHEVFHRFQEGIPLLPGAREVLEYARGEGMGVFLLSTIAARHWEIQATRLDVARYFRKAYTGALDKRVVIGDLLMEQGALPSETLFVGDMRHDVDSAKSAGVVAAAVLTGYDSLEKLKQSQPDHLFRDLFGLLGFLQRHSREASREDRPVATVGALIFGEGGRVLLVQTHKWSDLWGIPGGKIRRGERAEEALRREVKEETGLDLVDVRYVETQDCIDCPEFFRPEHFLLMNYTATAVAGEVALNDEASRHVWIDGREALSALPLNTPTRRLMERVLMA